MTYIQIAFPDGRQLFLNLDQTASIMFTPERPLPSGEGSYDASIVIDTGSEELLAFGGKDAEAVFVAIQEGLIAMSEQIINREAEMPS